MPKRKRSWIQRQEKDIYVRQARDSHYRSRAVYKLSEIDKRDKLFNNVNTVIDIGASPGSWSQYASEKLGSQGRIIAVDILPIAAIDKVNIIEGDFTDENIVNACLAALSERKADLVLSDIAPNLSGVKNTDQARSIYLAELVLAFAGDVLVEGGDLLVKLFQGDGTDQYKAGLKQVFQRVMVRKPRASRPESRELYVLARGYKV